MRCSSLLCALALARLAPVATAAILYQPHIPRCGTEILVSWDSVPDATGYDLQVSTEGAWSDWKTNVNATSATYAIKPGETPRFRIRALGARHVSGWERPVAASVAGAEVEITSPEPGLHARRKDQILLTANAPEDACGIREIAWMLDGKEIARAAKAPYRYVLTCPVLGRHQVIAAATMEDGSTRSSAPMPFRVTRYPDEGREDVDYVVVYPGMVETPAKARQNRYHKSLKPAGKGQKLETWYAVEDIDAPSGFYIDQPYEVVTNDGFPPHHLRWSVSLEGSVGSDEEMRRARMYQWDAKKKAWRIVESATLDEEKMTLSAPITEQGIYCLSAPAEEPKAPDVWWLSPAEGETVSGRTRILAAGRHLSKASNAMRFRLERLDTEKLIMVTEGTGSFVGEFGNAMDLDRRSVEEIERTLAPRTMPQDEETRNAQELMVNFSAFTPGRYRLVATASSTSAARTITIASSTKPPTVTVDAKPGRSTERDMGYTLTGTLKPGTLGNSYGSYGGVSLVYDGFLNGQGKTDLATGRWSADVTDAFDAGPAEITVYAFDSMMNRSEPVRWKGSVPLTVELSSRSDETIRKGQAVRMRAWAEGGAVKDGTRFLFEASGDSGKTWKTFRPPASSPDLRWTAARAGKFRIRATVTNGSEKIVKTVNVSVKG